MKFSRGTHLKVAEACYSLIEAIKKHDFDLLKKKQKLHLLLHLSECMEDFGEASCFSTERLAFLIMNIKYDYPHAGVKASMVW